MNPNSSLDPQFLAPDRWWEFMWCLFRLQVSARHGHLPVRISDCLSLPSCCSALQIPPTVKVPVPSWSARLAISFRAHVLVVGAFCATSGFKSQIAHFLVVWLLASYLTFLFLRFLIYKISIMIPPAEGVVIIQYDHLCKVAQSLAEVRPHYYYFWYWYVESTPLMTSFYSVVMQESCVSLKCVNWMYAVRLAWALSRKLQLLFYILLDCVVLWIHFSPLLTYYI